MATRCLAVYLPPIWIVCKSCKISRRALFIRSISVPRQLPLFVNCTGCLSSRESSLRSRCMCTTVFMVPHPFTLKTSSVNTTQVVRVLGPIEIIIVLPFPKQRAFGDKSFAVVGRKLWKCLPANLREALVCNVSKNF